MDGQPAPVDVALDLGAAGIAKGRIGIDGALRRFRFVGEHPAPAREGGERERVAHIDIAGQREGRGLRHGAGIGTGAAACLGAGLGQVVALKQREERDLAAAFLQQQREKVFLLLSQHADRLRQRDLDGALPRLVQRIAIGLQLGPARVAAGERPRLIADMLVQHRRRPAERPGIDRFAQQRLDLRRLLTARRAFKRGFAHDVVPERRQRRDKAEIERRAALVGGGKKFREGLPVPGDPLVQHLERDRLDIDKVARCDLARLRAARRDPDTAIPHDDRSDAMPGGG